MNAKHFVLIFGNLSASLLSCAFPFQLSSCFRHSFQFLLDFILLSGVRRGVSGGFNPPPEQEKLLQKNEVISYVIFSNKFSQKLIKMQFSIEFSPKIFKIFSNFPQTIVFFVQTRENLTNGFENFLQNRRKCSIFAIVFGNFL